MKRLTIPDLEYYDTRTQQLYNPHIVIKLYLEETPPTTVSM